MNNPLFKHVTRPEYELPQLMRSLGEVDSSKPLDDTVRNSAEAVSMHAYNMKEILLMGIESFGSLLMLVSQLPEPVQERDLLGLGGIIRHSAIQLQYAIDVEDEVDGILRRDKELTAAKKGAK